MSNNVLSTDCYRGTKVVKNPDDYQRTGERCVDNDSQIEQLKSTFPTQTESVKKSDRFTAFKRQDHNRKKGCIDDWSPQADASVDTIV